jgi:hypothetical protein
MRTFENNPKTNQQTTSARSTIPGRAHPGHSHNVNSVLHLQRTNGNQAVQRMLQTNAEELKAGSTGTTSSRYGHPPVAGAIQTKLAINKPGDEYEREADRVSEQVMRMPDPHAHRKTPGHAPVERSRLDGAAGSGLIQRSDSGRPLAEDEQVQAQAQPGATPTVSAETASGIQSLRGRGQSLPEQTRSFFEPRFGCDLRNVKIHDDSQAARLADNVGARAFTIGRDVMFGPGEYRPDTAGGMRLMAHELTHVVQQGGTSGGISRAPRESVAETISRMPRETISRVCHDPDFPPNAKVGAKWYSHDFIGPIPADSVRAAPANAGYAVPSSSDASYNCMGWAVSEFGTTKGWLQGVNRDASHPWPEEELLTGKGCNQITSSATADHKVRLYEYKNQDQFHIVRQECDGLWSGKTGTGPLWRGVTSPEDHTTSSYSQPLSNLRITDWACG